MLERQVISIPFGQGVDTKTDPKQVSPGKLLELENGVFTTLKALRKRDGNVMLGSDIDGGGAISNGSGLATFGNELLLSDGERIYSYAEGNDSWTSKGTFLSTQVAKNSVVRDGYTQSNPDGAVATNGLQAYAWQDSSAANTIRYTIIDSATRQTVVSSALLTSNGIKPRVLCNGGTFLFYFYDLSSQTIKLAQLAASTPTATPVASSITTNSANENSIDSTSPNYDCFIVERYPSTRTVIAVAFNNANTVGAGETTVRIYQHFSPTLQSGIQVVLPYRSRAITIFPSLVNGQNQFVVANSTDNGVSQTTTIQWAAMYVVDAPSTQLTLWTSGGLSPLAFNFRDEVYTLTGCSPDTTQEGFELFWGDSVGDVKTSRTVFDSSYTSTTELNWRLGVVPSARAFVYNGQSYLPVVHNSTLQSTYFVITGPGNIVAKALPGLAGARPTTYSGYTAAMPFLPGVTQVDVDTFLYPCLETANLGGAGFTTGTGVSSLTIDIDEPVHSFAHETLANNLHFTGGFVQMYDGVDVVEHGFHLYPESVTATGLTFGGSMSAGTYSYCVCYEWIDQQNNIHRSAPSVPVTATVQVASPPDQGSVLVVVPYLQLTDKVGERPVQVVLYRTVANGEILYRLSSLTAPNVNQVGTTVTFTYNDTQPDSLLVSNSVAARPEMYTQPIASFNTGSPAVLENKAAPPAKLIQLHRNRLWVVDSTNPLQLWYSKEAEIGGPVEFSEELIKQVDPRGGDITALATIDDKLLVFKYSHIFVIIGRGPTGTGETNDLSDSILVTTDVGCVDPRSVVGTPVGIMFKTAKGVYLIDRSLQAQYVGAPVEAYNDETITSSLLLNDKNQVRFTLSGGKTLVYDYLVQQWGAFTNQQAFDSLIWQGASTMLRQNGRVLKETAGVWTDAGSPYSLKVTTAWMTFANIQGFQRVRRAQILGAWKSPHNLAVDVYVDFNDTVVQSMTVTPQIPQVYGGVSPYGAGLYGGEFQLYQWRIDLARQKNQAVKFTIRDLPTATAGEGMSLSSIAFEVGAKQGVAKVPKAQIFS
jgi:hypothetical protein